METSNSDSAQPISELDPTIMPTSRLVQKQQQSLLRQSLMFIGIAVALVIGCILLIPLFIRLAGGKIDPSSLTKGDDIPPQVPVLYTQLEATSSAKFVLQGYTEKDAQVVLLDNTSKVSEAAADGDGNFHFEFDLQPGDNVLTTYAINQQGTESQVSPEYKVLFDSEAPKLEVSEPADATSIQGKKNQNLTVKGTSEANVHITLNDRMVTSDVDGNFSTTFRLNTGENQLSVKATDLAGNVTEKKLTITFAE